MPGVRRVRVRVRIRVRVRVRARRTVPGVHGTGAVAPTLHAAPLVHGWHSSAVVSLLVLPGMG